MLPSDDTPNNVPGMSMGFQMFWAINVPKKLMQRLRVKIIFFMILGFLNVFAKIITKKALVKSGKGVVYYVMND